MDKINLNNDGIAVILHKYYKIKKCAAHVREQNKKGDYEVHITLNNDVDDIT